MLGQAVELRRQLCSGQDDSQKQSGASGAAKGAGSGGGTGGGTGAARLALPQSSGAAGISEEQRLFGSYIITCI